VIELDAYGAGDVFDALADSWRFMSGAIA